MRPSGRCGAVSRTIVGIVSNVSFLEGLWPVHRGCVRLRGIARAGGGLNANFTVRRMASHGVGVERTFLLNAPRVDSITVVRRGKVRRSRLFYLRGLTGKAARIKERR